MIRTSSVLFRLLLPFRARTARHRLRRAAALLAMAVAGAVFLNASPAQAHPHVWVTAKTVLVFDAEGALTALHHAWAFDKPYSAYITTGLDTNRDGKLSEEELAELAKENTEGLADFGYFTKLRIHGKDQAFDMPRNFRMHMEDGNLVQEFDLPLKTPAKDPKIIGLEVFDESYFVAFSLAEGNDAVTLSPVSHGCAITVSRPKQASQADLSQFSEDYFANAGMGAQYANKAVIACP